MAGLTKEQRAQRAAEKSAVSPITSETATEPTDSGEAETKTIEIINQPGSEENKIDTVITTITMETAEEKKVQKFSELTHKDMLVIQNTNGNKQAVTKRYWEECVASELDRLQGIILLGKYVKDSEHEDGYIIEEIEDDSVVE